MTPVKEAAMANRNYRRSPAGNAYQSSGRSGYHQNPYAADSYVYGAAAPMYDPFAMQEREEYRKDNTDTRREPRQKAQHFMNPLAVMTIIAMVGLISYFLFQYVSLQSKVTTTVKEIASLESQLATLKSDNGEKQVMINSSVSLDDIKYRAIAELGMTYAQEDQIVTYDGESGDYVRQVTKIGQ